MTKVIDSKKIEWNAISCLDNMGHVFYYEGECYRAIRNNRNQLKRVEKLFSSGLIDELEEKGMILPISKADVCIENNSDYGMFLKTKLIKNVLYPTEWSYSMLLDAALLMVKMEKVLLKYGYTFYDYHPYNIVFDENLDCYHVDLGSIVLADEGSKQQFLDAMIQKYYRPLYIWQKNRKSVAEFYLRERVIDEKEWNTYLWGSIAGNIIGNYFNVQKCTTLKKLRIKLESLTNFEREVEIGQWEWSNYQDECIADNGTIIENRRFALIANCIKKYEIDAITELASNQGAFSQYCLNNQIIQYSLATDYDEWAVDKMYNRIKKSENIKNLSVGVVDIINPKARDSYNCGNRMRNTAVVAMALTHHLCLSQGCSFERALDIILNYGEKYAFIEFMPLGLYSKNSGGAPILPKWYTIENFRREFEKRCILKEEIRISNNRVLFVGEIRRKGI